MFGIFNKKKFLIDYLEGLVDIHNHILPGIDDGAKTVDESLEIIKTFSEFGIRNFIATPHIMHNYYPNDANTINTSLTLLKNGLLMNEVKDVSIKVAAEHMIDANFETLLENREVMPLQKNYLLIEMSYLQASINFDDAIQKIAAQRYFPILAHPERYVYLHNRMGKHRKYKEQGILFQLNLLSLSEFYSKNVQQTAFKLLEEGMIDYVASDVHNMNQLRNLKEIKITHKMLDKLMPVIEGTINSFS